MKHPHHTEQKNLNARTLTLRNLSAQFLEQSLYVGPSDIGRDRPGMNQFDGALMFAFHQAIVPIVDIINNKNKELTPLFHFSYEPATPKMYLQINCDGKPGTNLAASPDS